MAAQHARSASGPLSDAAQTHPQYFKAGTIERIYDDCGQADGRRLPFQSKAIAAFLILKAQKNRGYTCILPEREICATLGIDGKTFRKYLAPLLEAKLVLIDKNRRDATRCFDCKPLFKRYADETVMPNQKVRQLGELTSQAGFGIVSQIIETPRETALRDRESFGFASGNDPVSVRESIPSPNNPSYFLMSTSHLNGVFQDRFGKAPPPNCERELRVLLYGFDAFEMTERRQRALVKRYGIYTVANAIAYVLNQQRVTRVENPPGFVTFALERGLQGDAEATFAEMERSFGKVSRSTEPTAAEAETPKSSGIVSQRMTHEDRVVGDLWQATLSYLETRLSAPELNMLVRPARPIGVEQGVLTLGVSSTWVRERLNERCADAIITALETLIGPPMKLEIVVLPADGSGTVP